MHALLLFSSVLSLLFLSAFAAPTHTIFTLVQNVYGDVKQHTLLINSTVANLTADSSDEEKQNAVDSISSAIESITTAIQGATNQTETFAPTNGKVKARAASTVQIAGVVQNLLLDLDGALQNVESTLGLDSLRSPLDSLVLSLSGLLIALDRVVDNLLAVVKRLVDGLLIGLAAGLAGIVL